MKLALDAQMFFATASVYELPDLAAGLGYSWIELSGHGEWDVDLR